MLCGIQDRSGGTISPAPWSLYFTTTAIVFALRLGTGITYVSVPLALSSLPADLTLTASVNLDTGAGAVTVNGTPASFSVPAASALTENHAAPFCVARLEPHWVGTGWAGEDTRDITVSLVRVSTDGTLLAVFQPDANVRPATYPGGPSLPICYGWTRHNGRAWLVAVRTNQAAEQYAISGVKIQGLRLTTGGTTGTGVLIGTSFGAAAEDVSMAGGTRVIQNVGGNVCYPLALRNCAGENQTDCAIHLTRVIGTFDFAGRAVKYSGRAALDLHGCSVTVRDLLYAPPGWTSPSVIEQRGGQVRYESVKADYEYTTPAGFALLHAYPDSFDAPTMPTTADLVNCSAGTAPPARVLDRAAGYAAPVRVTADGIVLHAS